MIIKRDIEAQLLAWKQAPQRKPLLLQGARQIGKTWVMEHFGRTHYRHCVKFDFDRMPELRSVFKITKQPERLLKELSAYCEAPLLPEETLIIFDEIQECEETLKSLN